MFTYKKYLFAIFSLSVSIEPEDAFCAVVILEAFRAKPDATGWIPSTKHNPSKPQRKGMIQD